MDLTWWTALWTALGAFGASASVVILLAGFILAIRQLRLQTRTLQAQTFLNIQQRAESMGFSQSMDEIRRLSFQNYEVYTGGTTEAQRQRVRSVVDFFNDMQHLIDRHMLDSATALGLYTMSIRSCADRLLPWWLDGFRAEQGQHLHYASEGQYFYEAFQRLCDAVPVQGKSEGVSPGVEV